jgi:type IV secretory pathway VirB2 component (pilin)
MLKIIWLMLFIFVMDASALHAGCVFGPENADGSCPGDTTTATSESSPNSQKEDKSSIFLCKLYSLVTGPGKVVAILIFVALGIGYFLGKANFMTILYIVLGIMLIFGAPFFVRVLTGGQARPCLSYEQLSPARM